MNLVKASRSWATSTVLASQNLILGCDFNIIGFKMVQVCQSNMMAIMAPGDVNDIPVSSPCDAV